MTKFIYCGNHWLPFPQSEYGGMWTVIAENRDECFELMKKFTFGNDDELEDLRKAVNQASEFELADDLVSEVVDTFFT